MNNYCRLCADLKTGDELNIKISDSTLKIQEKLIACCQWNNYTHNTNFPNTICYLCYEKLEKSWLFSKSIEFAQTKLQEFLHNIELAPMKYDSDVDDNKFNAYDSGTEEIFVEPIAPSDETKSYECITTKKLKALKKNHAIERSRCCSNCGKEFKTSSNLRRHMRNVHGQLVKPKIDAPEYKYECYECHRKFRLKWTLKKHMTVHSDDRPYECWLCHKAVKRKTQLKSHLKLHVEFFDCKICGKLFCKKMRCDRHMIKRHGIQKRENKPLEASVRQFTCELCGVSYLQQGGLTNHLQTAHSETRPWKCDICGLGYKLKCILNAHLKSHTKFEFKCNQCEKVFRKKISLKRHLEYHTGTVVKPFACDYCDKTFRLNFNLVEHRRIHTGEKPFACEHCSSTFRTMSNFYSHLRKEHGISVSAKKLEERARATARS